MSYNQLNFKITTIPTKEYIDIKIESEQTAF